MSVLYNVNNVKILFIHIPKNGGRTVDSVLSKFTTREKFIVGHPDISQIVDIKSIKVLEEVDHILYVTRNVYERAASLYNYFRNHEASEHGHFLEKKYFANNDFENSLSWLLSIYNDPKKLDLLSGSKYGNTISYLAIKDQQSFVDLNFIQDTIVKENIKKKMTCIRLENILDDLTVFLTAVVKIKDNQSIESLLNLSHNKFKSIKQKNSSFSRKEKELISKLFKKDLNLVGKNEF